MKKKLQMMLAVSLFSVTLLLGCGQIDTSDEIDTIVESVTQIEENIIQDETIVESSSEQTEEIHTHDYVETLTTDATCTEKGIKTFSCECGDTYTEEIPATAHNYGEGFITTEATCETDGVRTFTCECGNTYTEKIAATGHSFDNVVDSVKKASCTKDGKEYDTKCAICGYVVTGATVSATGHDYGDYVYNDDATTSKDGTETATCSVCGDKDTRTKEGTKLDVVYVWIPKTGSKYHSNSSCSNMKNPSQVTIEKAKQLGYQPCKKCY